MQNCLNHVKNKKIKQRWKEPKLENLHIPTQRNTTKNTLMQIMLSSNLKEPQKQKDNSSLKINPKLPSSSDLKGKFKLSIFNYYYIFFF